MTHTALLPCLTGPEDGDITWRLREFVSDREAFSDNTWQQLLSVMRIAGRWAAEHGRALLPMAPADLRDYLLWLQASGRASSTISTHAALIFMLHRNAGLIPPNASPQVFRAVKKINRTAVTVGERAGQAIPFRLQNLLSLDACWSVSARLQQRRDLLFCTLLTPPCCVSASWAACACVTFRARRTAGLSWTWRGLKPL
ncbi:hypothetical protein ACUXI4_004355 [Pantoea piersonii]|jgi:hypothetical protein